MIKQIVMDVPRTMPNNRDFSATDSIHRDRLQRVLTAFCIHADSDIGYCQGFNFLAGGGLLFLEEEDVFWYLIFDHRLHFMIKLYLSICCVQLLVGSSTIDLLSIIIDLFSADLVILYDGIV